MRAQGFRSALLALPPSHESSFCLKKRWVRAPATATTPVLPGSSGVTPVRVRVPAPSSRTAWRKGKSLHWWGGLQHDQTPLHHHASSGVADPLWPRTTAEGEHGGGGWGCGGADAALFAAADSPRLRRRGGDRIRHHGRLRGSSQHAAAAAAAAPSIDLAPTPTTGRLWPITHAGAVPPSTDAELRPPLPPNSIGAAMHAKTKGPAPPRQRG